MAKPYYGNPNQTTPTEVTPKLAAFAAELTDKPTAFVQIQAEPWAKKGECHDNAARYCQEHEGCEVVNGYILWANEIYIDAEYHAVVRLADGTFLDPTPADESRILFAPIEGSKDRLSPNRLAPLVDNFYVKQLVNALNDYNLAVQEASRLNAQGQREIRLTEKVKRRGDEVGKARKAVDKAFPPKSV